MEQPNIFKIMISQKKIRRAISAVLGSQKDELAYLLFSGKSELYLRDRLAYQLVKRCHGYSVAREYNH
jgi:hypothetical protein